MSHSTTEAPELVTRRFFIPADIAAFGPWRTLVLVKINYNLELEELVKNTQESIKNILWLYRTQFYKHQSYTDILQEIFEGSLRGLEGGFENLFSIEMFIIFEWSLPRRCFVFTEGKIYALLDCHWNERPEFFKTISWCSWTLKKMCR